MPLPTFKDGSLATPSAVKSRFGHQTLKSGRAQVTADRARVTSKRLSNLNQQVEKLSTTINPFKKAKHAFGAMFALHKLRSPITQDDIQIGIRDRIAKTETKRIEQELEEQYAPQQSQAAATLDAFRTPRIVAARRAEEQVTSSGAGTTVLSQTPPVKHMEVPSREEARQMAATEGERIADSTVLQNLIAIRTDPSHPAPSVLQRAKGTAGVVTESLTLGIVKGDRRHPLIKEAEGRVFPKPAALDVAEGALQIGSLFIPYVGLELGAVKIGRGLRAVGAVDKMYDAHPLFTDLVVRNLGVAVGEAGIKMGSGQEYGSQDFFLNIGLQGMFDSVLFSGTKSRIFSHLDNQVFKLKRELGRAPTTDELLENVAHMNVPGHDFNYGHLFAERRLAYKSGIDPNTGKPPKGGELGRVSTPATGNPDDVIRGLRVDKVNSTEAQEVLQKALKDHPDILNSRTRGVISNAESVEKANILQVSKDQVLAFPEGTILNNERRIAMSQMIVAHGEDVARLGKLAEVERIAGESTKIQDSYRTAFFEHAELLARQKGVATEGGRLVQGFKTTIEPISRLRKKLNDLVATSDKELREKLSRDIGNIDVNDPVQVMRLLRQYDKTSFWGVLREIGVSSKLWRASTQVVNISSNALQSLARPTFKVFHAGADTIRVGGGKMFGKNVEREVFFGEALYDLKGQFMGIPIDKLKRTDSGLKRSFRVPVRDIIKTMKKYKPFATPEQAVEEGRWEGIRQNLGEAWKALLDEQYMPIAGTAEDVIGFRGPQIKGRRGQHTMLDTTLDVTGKVVRTPFRLLNTGDVAFRTLNMSGELSADAYRIAAKEGLKGEALHKRAIELMQNPSPAMTENMRKVGERSVFQEPLDAFNQHIQRARQVPIYGDIFTIGFLAFFRTIANLTKRGVAMGIPVPFVNQLKKGGREASAEMARFGLAATSAAIMHKYAMEGYITGGVPENKNLREELFQSGWQPFSVRVGDKYYSYDRIEPFGQVFRMHAAIADAYRETGKMDEEMVANSVGLMLRYTLDRSYIKGIFETFRMLFDSDRYAQDWLNSFMFSNIPMSGVFSDLTALTDVDEQGRQILREKGQNFTEYFKTRFPTTAQDQPRRFDTQGRPISLPGGQFGRVFSPVRVSGTEKSKDEIDELIREFHLISRLAKEDREEKDLANDAALNFIEKNKELDYDKFATNMSVLHDNQPAIAEKVIDIYENKSTMDLIQQTIKGKSVKTRAKWIELKLKEVNDQDFSDFIITLGVNKVLTRSVAKELGMEEGLEDMGFFRIIKDASK